MFHEPKNGDYVAYLAQLEKEGLARLKAPGEAGVPEAPAQRLMRGVEAPVRERARGKKHEALGTLAGFAPVVIFIVAAAFARAGEDLPGVLFMVFIVLAFSAVVALKRSRRRTRR